MIEMLEPRCVLTGMPLALDGQSYGTLPLTFEPNAGQVAEEVDFVSRARGYTLFLADAQAVISLPSSNSSAGFALRMTPVGANTGLASRGLAPLASRSNYFLGNDPQDWQSNVAHFGRVQYDDVYEGIDLVYYGNQSQLEYDFIVEPGADPGTIALRIEGADSLSLDAAGNLVLHTPRGELVERAPVTFQVLDGVRQIVPSRYVLNGDQVSFDVGAYDPLLPLTIDPVITYSTFLGGDLGDQAFAVAADGSGNAYVTGETGSLNFPTTAGAFDRTIGGGNTVTDVFVTKINSAGDLVYSTFLGGFSDDHGTGIAVDKSGNAYITGWTSQSDNFPTTATAFQKSPKSGVDGFVTKLNSNGSKLVYSTYLGGGASDFPRGIAVLNGNAYVAGETLSTNFPTKNPVQGGKTNTGSDGFLTKLNTTGSGLVYSTYLRGASDGNDVIYGVSVDPFGNAAVGGETNSTDFPVTANAFQKSFQPPSNQRTAFVTLYNSQGNAYKFSTYLSGNIDDVVYGVATDWYGNVYVTGETWGQEPDATFPTTADAAQHEAQQVDRGLSDAFVTKFAPGGGLVYSTRVGGGGTNSTDRANAIAVDVNGFAYITGYTSATSSPFPTRRAFQPVPQGNFDAFVTKINRDGQDWDYSSYLGGTGHDQGNGIAVDKNGYVYVVGTTRTLQGEDNDFPVVNPIKSAPPEEFDEDGFVTRIRPDEPGAGTFAFVSGLISSTETGGEALVYVRRFSGTAKAASVTYTTQNDTAIAGSDYTAKTGVLSFAVGEFEKIIRIPILNDTANEGTQKFKVKLSNPTNGATISSPDPKTVEILDDDRNVFNDNIDNRRVLTGATATSTVSNVNATSEFAEPFHDMAGAGKSLWWTWTAPADGLVTVNTTGSNFDTVLAVYWYRHSVSNNDGPGRFDVTSQVRFVSRKGENYFIAVDGNTESFDSSGNVKLNLSLQKTGVIAFSTSSYTVNEGAGTATITVTRTGGSAGQVTVQYSTVDNTAGVGDYTAARGQLVFAAGQTTKTFTVPIKNDTLDESNEIVSLRLASVMGGAILGSRIAKLTIVDNDPSGIQPPASAAAAPQPILWQPAEPTTTAKTTKPADQVPLAVMPKTASREVTAAILDRVLAAEWFE